MGDTVRAETQFVSSEMMNLLQETWFLVPNWKWIALALAIVLVFVLRPFVQLTLYRLKRASPWARNEATFLSKVFSLNIESPLSWLVSLWFFLVALNAIALPDNFGPGLATFAKIFIAYNVIRLMYLAADAAGLMLTEIASRTENTLDDQLAPFASKTLKIFAVILGVLLTLQNFGINVMALLAGLGIGGIAIAFAAQDTVSNVFGSITILLDQTFRQGDFVKIGDTEGTIEDIGFRSTRIRTPYNSLVILPNSTVAKEKIDNMTVRPRRRVRQVLGILYETPPSMIDQFCKDVRAVLESEPAVDKKDIFVAFVNFNAAQLDILVQFHLPGVTDYAVELQHTQRIFNRVIEVATKLGVEFAYPTQTVYMKGLPNPEREPTSIGLG